MAGLTKALGLCINAANSVPEAAEYAALGIGPGDWVRTAVQGSIALLGPVIQGLPDGVNLVVTLNNECREVGGGWEGWENACALIAHLYSNRVKIVSCGNELDIFYYQGDSSVSPAFAANLVKRAAPILRPAGIKVAMSSVASGSWPTYLAEMSRLCQGSADYSDLHLYVKRLNGVPNNPDWQTAEAALVQAHNLSGLPVISSEAGIKIDDAGGLDQQAKWAAGLGGLPAELVCFWCWHDRMASPGETGGQAFGARGLDGKQKPVWSTLQSLFRESTPVPIPTPEPPPADQFVVGTGMRALMAKRGDIPASDEIYFKNPAGKDQFSEAVAASGRMYRYVPSVRQTFSYSAEVA